MQKTRSVKALSHTGVTGGIIAVAFAACALASCLCLAGCSASSSKSSQQTGDTSVTDSRSTSEDSTAMPVANILVFAADSLSDALPEIQELYKAENSGTTFANTRFAASADLADQVTGGAGFDILITASEGSMDDVEQADRIETDTRATMLTSDLVAVVKKGSGIKIDSLADIVDIMNAGDKIAIGDAASMEAGIYANQTLASIGLYSNVAGYDGEYADSVNGSILLEDKLDDVAELVSSGQAALGLICSCEAYRYTDLTIAYTIPATSHKTIKYPSAIEADCDNADIAADFLDFCKTDKDAQKIWADYGFKVAESG